MRIFTELVMFIAGNVRGRPINIDRNIAIGELLGMIIKNGLGAVRGVLRLRRLIILGRGVELSGSGHFRAGKGVVVRDYAKLSCLGTHGLHLGDGVSIGAFSMLSVSGSISDLGSGISIGNNVGIGDFAHIGGAGAVRIGDDCIIGSNFSVHPENHKFGDLNIPIREQGVTRQGIEVGANCWIGAKVTLLDGAKIGDGCVIAAGAVVKGSFPENSVIGGVYARVISKRNKESE